MIKILRQTTRLFLTLAMILATGCPAMAQRSASELELLREESVREELGISGDKAADLEAVLKISRPDKEFYEPYMKRISEAGSDSAKKSAVQKEMFAAVKAKVAETKSKALTILNETQRKMLRGIFLRSTGVRVFSDPRVAKDYGIDEAQAKKFSDLASAYRSAARALGDADDAARDKFAADWKAKFMANMTSEQRKKFEGESNYGQAPTDVSSAAAGSNAADPAMNQPPEGVEAIGTFGGGEAGSSKRVSEFRFNFRYEQWETVLQMYADGAGLTLDLNQIPPGTFSHYDDNAYTARQTLDILNGYLNRKGFVMVENDNFLIVMNTDNGIPPYLIRDVTEEELLKVGKELTVGNNELANFRISVDGMDTGKVAQEVEAILGPLGSLVALTDSHLLIITDVGANLRRIQGFLTEAMSKAKPDALMFKSYHLVNMDAEEAEIAVLTQFGMRQNVQNVSSAAEEQRRSQARSQAFSRTQSPQRGGTPAPAASSSEPAVQIASDMRLNSLLVTGTAKQHELVETILKALDVNEDAAGNPLDGRRRGSYLEVYKVSSADAREVTKTLGAMNIPGVNVVNEDGNNGTIHIVASQKQHEEVAALIRQLDGGGVSGSVAVIQLAQMDPLSAAATLRSLFYADGAEAPTIETDLYGRRLIVRGSVDQIAQIKQVLADLGEDGTGIRDRGDGGLVRRFSLQGRNPEQFLEVLQQQWKSQQETKINIVIPNETSPIGSRRTPEEEFDRPGKRPAPAEKPENSNDDNLSRRQSPVFKSQSNRRAWGWQQPEALTTAMQNAAQPATAEAATQPPQQNRSWDPQNRGEKSQRGSDSGVFIQLLGDDLILSAADESQLDELEDLLDFLHQSLPMKPEYTVVYLKAADALEAADMLSQFFPSSSVATSSVSVGASSSMLGGLGSSLGNMGSSLMDMTGLSGLGASSSQLRIIPDIRTNSLFITGPQSLIKDALVFLRVLDSNDLPQSLKDMQPRQIMVKHADVEAVSSLLQDVFKPYMEAQGGGKDQQQLSLIHI